MGFKIKVLHLCSAYVQNNLYSELIDALDKTGISQDVYIPVKRKKDENKNILKNINNTTFIYSKIFNDFDRFLYFRKINKLVVDIKTKLDIDSIDIIHAHTLFSMGGIALKLKREKNIDYIVAVRSTDVNLFFKYLFYLRGIGIQILSKSKKVIFLSPAYREYVLEKIVPYYLRESIKKKSVVVPNGINPFFLENKYSRCGLRDKHNIKLIYVGSFLRRKNIGISVRVVKILKSLGYDVKLFIVGGNEKDDYRAGKLAKENEGIVEIYNHIKEKEKLLDMYKKADIFIMPSRNETFGLVYIEAMSQGLPVIYSKGQGIDGYFEDGEVGYPVKSNDADDIVNKIEMIISNYSKISKNCYELAEKFSWENIARTYYNIYMIS